MEFRPASFPARYASWLGPGIWVPANDPAWAVSVPQGGDGRSKLVLPSRRDAGCAAEPGRCTQLLRLRAAGLDAVDGDLCRSLSGAYAQHESAGGGGGSRIGERRV